MTQDKRNKLKERLSLTKVKNLVFKKDIKFHEDF